MGGRKAELSLVNPEAEYNPGLSGSETSVVSPVARFVTNSFDSLVVIDFTVAMIDLSLLAPA